MFLKQAHKILSVALPVLGSAILLISCGGGKNNAVEGKENIMTMRGDSILRFESEKGRLSNRFFTPLMEEYKYAPEPYVEYKRGIDIITYDSLGQVKSTLVASYAINHTNLRLWEVKGNVVGTNDKGDRFLTEQLFWNQATKRIYSNVDIDIHQGEDVLRGQGFESNEEFNDWTIRRVKGTIRVNIEPTRDSTAVAQDSLATAEAMLPGEAATNEE